MKRKHTKTLIGTALMALFLIVSCTDILDEQPRAIYTPATFKTPEGVMGGLTAEYATLRRLW